MAVKPPLGPDPMKRKADARRSIRFPTRFPGELRASGRSQPISVRDISREGVLVEGEQLPTAGRSVTLAAKQFEVAAKVVWQRAAQCGLEFVEPVDPLEVVRQNVPELARFRKPTES